jgi:thiamine pyrophosphokinase
VPSEHYGRTLHDDPERPTVIVVSGGDPPALQALEGLPTDARVVAADSGLDFAHGLGLHVDVVVGDLDSVSEVALAAARHAGTTIERHPSAKDATDLELALDRAVELGAARIVVLGGAAGRFDHVVGGLLLLADERYENVHMTARLGSARVAVVRGEATLEGQVGDYVTLLPVAGPAEGITTSGLLYPLHNEDLLPGTTRGVSNELVTRTATVHVRQGVLFAIQPTAI